MLLEALFLGVIAGERMQQNAAARQVAVWDSQLKQMDVWDGIEHQIREHCNFYGKNTLSVLAAIRANTDIFQW